MTSSQPPEGVGIAPAPRAPWSWGSALMPSSNPLPREESMPGALCAPATMTVGSYPSPSPRGTTTGAQSGKPRHWRAAFGKSGRDEFRLGDHAAASSCVPFATIRNDSNSRRWPRASGPFRRLVGACVVLGWRRTSHAGKSVQRESCLYPNRTLARAPVSNDGFPMHVAKSWSGLVQSSRWLYCSA